MFVRCVCRLFLCVDCVMQPCTQAFAWFHFNHSYFMPSFFKLNGCETVLEVFFWGLLLLILELLFHYNKKVFPQLCCPHSLTLTLFNLRTTLCSQGLVSSMACCCWCVAGPMPVMQWRYCACPSCCPQRAVTCSSALQIWDYSPPAYSSVSHCLVSSLLHFKLLLCGAIHAFFGHMLLSCSLS